MEWKAKPEGCRGCPLWLERGPVVRDGEVVRGEGPRDARMMFVAEAPSWEEISRGSVLVGPAGRVFSLALKLAGVERKTVYINNWSSA